jgi:hypothetical protein
MALTRPGGVFPWRRYVVVPNVSWGLVSWEADLVAMAPSGYLYEVEIKVSHQDLKADLEKPKHRRWKERGDPGDVWRKLRGFYYAMPRKIYDLATKAQTAIPAYAGIIVVTPSETDDARLWCEVVRTCTINKTASKLTTFDQYQLARLGVMRYWTRREAREIGQAAA